MTPKGRSPDWLFLGFDVGDGGLLSGLMNCGYEDAERKALAEEWGPRLNEHHLFKDAESALAFRLVSNRRAAEHAPFFVLFLAPSRPSPVLRLRDSFLSGHRALGESPFDGARLLRAALASSGPRGRRTAWLRTVYRLLAMGALLVLTGLRTNAVLHFTC